MLLTISLVVCAFACHLHGHVLVVEYMDCVLIRGFSLFDQLAFKDLVIFTILLLLSREDIIVHHNFLILDVQGLGLIGKTSGGCI
jgi:hypothetical protein